jgi:hypothetical protein
MLYYSMSFVSLDVDVADNLNHCCCNVFDDLVNGDDYSFYLELRYQKMLQKDIKKKFFHVLMGRV